MDQDDKITIVANYIVKVESELEYRLFEASLASVEKFCDRIVVVYAPGNEEPMPDRLTKLLTEFNVSHTHHYVGPVFSFAEIRNLALDEVKDGEFLYWIDADEVGFPIHLAGLRRQMERLGSKLMKVRTRFTHFCVSPHWYERMEPRNTLIRKIAGMHWEGNVHERLVGVPETGLFNSDYTLHHYGYCKPQEEVFKHWQHYAELEGDPNRYINEEVDGKTVSYFRPGERPSAAHILDDRIKTLIPYTGEYPDYGLLSYLEEVCPHV